MAQPESPEAKPKPMEELGRHESGNTQASSERLTQEAIGSWTIAIDLATNLRGPDGKHNGEGAVSKWIALQQLKNETANKTVSFVVAVAKPYDDNPLSAPIGQLKLPASDHAANTGSQRKGPAETDFFASLLSPKVKPDIETFLISNGDITSLGIHQSLGVAQDAAELLSVARKQAPSEKLGFMINAHGTGTDFRGIEGDAGTSSQTALSQDIAQKLEQDRKLDVMVIDGCRMSSTETAHVMKTVANALVASEDQEIASGLNLNAPLHALLSKPSMTGRDLANQFIEEAKNGANGQLVKTDYDERLRSGADTVTALDLTKYDQFEESLNTLAAKLNARLADASARDAIATATDESAALPGRNAPYTNFQRDTKQFAQNILDQVKRGNLTDDGSIKKAAEAILDAQSAMTIGYHGTSSFYQDLGGISVELYPAGKKSRYEFFKARSIPGAVVQLTEDNKPFAAHVVFEQKASAMMGMLYQTAPKVMRDKLSGLTDAVMQVYKAKTPEQYGQTMSQVRAAGNRFLDSQTGQEMVKEIADGATLDASPVTGKDWQEFVNALANPRSRF
jgi:hypothetical protein